MSELVILGQFVGHFGGSFDKFGTLVEIGEVV